MLVDNAGMQAARIQVFAREDVTTLDCPMDGT